MNGLRALAVTVLLLGAVSSRADFGAESFTLDNGVRVVAVPMARPGVVHHVVYYRLGAADDPWGQSGIAHLLEHLMFNGTSRFGAGEYDRIIGRNGGRANAYTSPDLTAYYATIARDRLEVVMELEADRMTGLVLEEENFEAERKVVLEERLQRVDNDPASLFGEELRAAIWRAHPYGRPIIGWRHEIEALTMDEVKAFYRRYYGPRNVLVVVAGDIDADSLRKLAEGTFGKIPAGGDPLPPRIGEPPHRAGVQVEMESSRVTRPRWSARYRTDSYYSGEFREAAVLNMLASVLGGSSGRLHRRLVMDQKVAMTAGAAYHGNKRDGGSFVVYGSPAEGHSVEDVAAAVEREMLRIVEEGIDPREVQRVAYRVVAGEIYARDQVSRLAELVGTTLAKGGSLGDIGRFRDVMQDIRTEEVVESARRLWADPATVTGILLPSPEG